MLDLGDALLVERVSSQEPRGLAAGRLIVSRKTLPETHSVFWIIPGASHEGETDFVGGAFQPPAVGQRHAHVRTGRVELLEVRAELSLRHGRASEDSGELDTLGHAHAFSAVTGHGVGHLVSNDRGQTSLILSNS